LRAGFGLSVIASSPGRKILFFGLNKVVDDGYMHEKRNQLFLPSFSVAFRGENSKNNSARKIIQSSWQWFAIQQVHSGCFHG